VSWLLIQISYVLKVRSSCSAGSVDATYYSAACLCSQLCRQDINGLKSWWVCASVCVCLQKLTISIIRARRLLLTMYQLASGILVSTYNRTQKKPAGIQSISNSFWQSTDRLTANLVFYVYYLAQTPLHGCVVVVDLLWTCCSVAANHKVPFNHLDELRHNLRHHCCVYNSDRNCTVNYTNAVTELISVPQRGYRVNEILFI